MRDLFDLVDDVSTEQSKAEEVWAWCQRWRAFKHLENVIVRDDIVHDNGRKFPIRTVVT
jgi:hypothetical protein